MQLPADRLPSGLSRFGVNKWKLHRANYHHALFAVIAGGDYREKESVAVILVAALASPIRDKPDGR